MRIVGKAQITTLSGGTGTFIFIDRRLNDGSIADVLTWLIAFVEAFEDHYAKPLSRWRQARYEELHQQNNDEQMRLPIDLQIDEPF